MARKILLADDSVTAQSMGRRILTDAGYEVVTVSNGSAALKKIAESRPDLIVLDVYMPGYGGLEVCQRLKETRETARIPVLLSVGKLEPFKPEEARRVRADAYIVKPFEASELLTALTKLEDKIVPQPEPYKQGRFAKALAAVEQFSTPEPGSRDEGFGDSETGWKDRLIIPHSAPKAAEPEAEAAHAGDTGFRNLPRGEDFKPAEPKQGFERPIPAGLPADISAEEIAAIAAAAAAVSGQSEEPVPPEQAPVAKAEAEPVATASEEPQPASAVPVPEEAQPEPAAPAVEEPKLEPAADESPSDALAATFASAPEVQPEAAPQTASETAPEATPAPPATEPPPVPEPVASSETVAVNESPAGAESPAAPVAAEPPSAPEPTVAEAAKHAVTDAEVLAALASLAPLNGDQAASAVERTEPDPVTVAAAIPSAELAAVGRECGGPRWMAEPMPVDEQESSFLLEREMEKAYAAFAAAEAAQTSFAAGQMETAAAALTEVPVATWQAPSIDTAPEFSSVAGPSPEEAVPAAVPESEPAASLPVEPAPVAVPDVVSEAPSFSEAVASPVAAASNDTVETASEEEVALAAAASASSGQMEATAAVQAPSQPAAPAESSHGRAQEFEEGERQRESELAAAWTNWTQVHQSTAASEAAAQIADAEAGFRDTPKEDPPTVEPKPEVEPEAEPEAATAAPEESADIANIVDNMLAELKPKLMAEISKKLKKKNKN